jgi:uncharacterized RDD family membrane protein YckC
MSCPLCGDECTCSYAGASVSFERRTHADISSTSTHNQHLIDPEAFDASEEHFAASLATSGPASIPELNTETEPTVANLSVNETTHDNSETGIEKKMFEDDQLQQESESWRDEITSRVHSYRRRRGKRIAGQYSMDLEFETPRTTIQGYAAAATAAAPALHEDPARNRVPRAFRNLVLSEEPVMASAEPAISEPVVAPAVEPEPALLPETEPEQDSFASAAPDSEPEPAPARRRRSHSEPKVIEFPRSANYSMFPSPDELAEPVLDRPRILDVPESVPAPDRSMLADIQLEEPEPEPVAEAQIEIPPQVAPVPVRVSAALVDWAVVVLASGLFAFIAHYLCGNVPLTKPVLAFALVLPCFFWALYQYLFMVYNGRTPGMRAVQLELRSFDGSTVHRPTRQLRALVMVLSCVSVGMGFLTAVLDDDTLCWHDRVTRTYLGRQ